MFTWDKLEFVFTKSLVRSLLFNEPESWFHLWNKSITVFVRGQHELSANCRCLYYKQAWQVRGDGWRSFLQLSSSFLISVKCKAAKWRRLCVATGCTELQFVVFKMCRMYTVQCLPVCWRASTISHSTRGASVGSIFTSFIHYLTSIYYLSFIYHTQSYNGLHSF